MNATTFMTIASTLLLGACSTLSSTGNTGKVADITATELRVCFPAGVAPAPGQDVRIVRPVVVGGAKPPMTYQDRTVGTARITALDDGCATAALTTGNARRHDDVRWPGESPK